jgi:hypothetical protein
MFVCMFCVSVCILWFFFFSGSGVWTQGLHLEPLCLPFFVLGIFEIGACKLLPGWLRTRDPPDLCFLSNWDYRREPSVSGEHMYFKLLSGRYLGVDTCCAGQVMWTEPHKKLTTCFPKQWARAPLRALMRTPGSPGWSSNLLALGYFRSFLF